MPPKPLETYPESDRFEDAPHPRESVHCFGHAGPERQFILSYLAGHLPHAFIIGGPPGIGKATLAWRLARFLLAYPDPAAAGEAKADLFVAPDHPAARQVAALAHPDLVLLRREWNEKDKRFFTEIRVEDVRRAIHMFQQAAGRGGYRICILDCAEDLNPSSANALLKLIEEPPPRSLFLIIAHRPGQMLATLRSRCQKILLKPLGGGGHRPMRGGAWTAVVGCGRGDACGRDRARAWLGRIMFCGSSMIAQMSSTPISNVCWTNCRG